MPGQLDTVFRPLAERLIEQFGMSMTYIQVAESFDATTGKVTATETQHSVVGTPPVPLSKRLASGESYRAVLGEVFDTVEAGDLITTIKAQNLGFTPALGDRLVYNDSTWQVVRVDPTYSGELPAAFTVQIRQ
jgi:hypothetical protein